MPGLSRNKVHHSFTSSSSGSSLCNTPSDARNSIWSRSNTEDVTYSQLQKFWNGLPADARRNLLRIDKQTLFEQVRKNLYCSRCHGLLVEGFSQIVMYGKNLSVGRNTSKCRKVYPEDEVNGNAGAGYIGTLQDDAKDPSLHPWGGLAATRDCMLTVLDCFLDGTSLEVFESARGRERERELLYPDACGGNGRGWISQSSGIYSSGRGHGIKETCALHTTRLSCEALVDFWSALSEETRRSLLRMKEEDFIERLMFRFDSKRFCRDCRRNVLREFKEMKELKRARKEPRCTRWFCAADTTFQYEVSDNAVQADWHESIAGEVGTPYQHFEWALGTAEGKSDIFGFEDVGLSDRVEVEGLDLGNIFDCFITLRAWKRDGRCSDFTVKAHALKGELCVHRRLFVGDGIVSITEGESIQRFFEHAEETEEEEDDDGFDKDGNELDGEGSRSQKHAKSPELARDFLLDAATVIFKEQVEKAFREGTARQNAHSIFVCLALGLLEDRVRVACKEIATLEKQNKLLEEEEHEKREEEERRERRKLKEKEKKLRRKEKLKCKEREKEKGKGGRPSSTRSEENVALQADSKQNEEGSLSDMTEVRLVPDESERSGGESPAGCTLDTGNSRDGSGAFIVEQSKAAKRRSNGKRQQVADSVPVRYSRRGTSMTFERVSHRGSSDLAIQERQTDSEPLKARNGFPMARQETQQCACTTTFWAKRMQESPTKVTRKPESRQLHVKAGVFKSRVPATTNLGSQKLPTSPESVRSRKEGMTYTKVVTKGLNANGVKHDVQLNGDVCCPLEDPVGGVTKGEAAPANESLSCGVDEEKSSDSQMMQVEPLVDRTELEKPLEAIGDGSLSGASAEVMDADSRKESPRNRADVAKEEPKDAAEVASAAETCTTPAAACSVPAAATTATAPPLGTPYPPPVCSPEVIRNGYVNGFVHGGAAKNHHTYTTVVEMLPVHSPPPPPPPPPPPTHHHIHRHPPPQSQQPGFACFPAVHGPWGGPQARTPFIPGAAPPMFIPGPAAFGYPRFPVPRIFHPPLRMPSLSAGEMVSMQAPPPPPPRPDYAAAAWIPVDATRPLLAPEIQEQQQSFKVEKPGSLGEPMQTATFSFQELQKEFRFTPNTFSLFHFGGGAATSGGGSSGGGGGASSNGGDACPPLVSDSPKLASSPPREANAEEVVVSIKCMDRLPSGINKASMNAGEYSLFAAAPGKGFGFF